MEVFKNEQEVNKTVSKLLGNVTDYESFWKDYFPKFDFIHRLWLHKVGDRHGFEVKAKEFVYFNVPTFVEFKYDNYKRKIYFLNNLYNHGFEGEYDPNNEMHQCRALDFPCDYSKVPELTTAEIKFIDEKWDIAFKGFFQSSLRPLFDRCGENPMKYFTEYEQSLINDDEALFHKLGLPLDKESDFYGLFFAMMFDEKRKFDQNPIEYKYQILNQDVMPSVSNYNKFSTITSFEFGYKKFRDSVLNKFEETQKEFETVGTISKTELGRKIEGMKIAFNELEDDNKDRKYVLANPLNEENRKAKEIVDVPPLVTSSSPFGMFAGAIKVFDVRIESEKNEVELLIENEDKFLKEFERLIQALIVFEFNLEGEAHKDKDYRHKTDISCIENGNLREKLLDSYDDTKRVFDYLFKRKNDETYLSFTDELIEELETHKITIEKNIKIIESLTDEKFVSESRKYLAYDNLLPKRFKSIFKYYKDGSIEFGSKSNKFIDDFYKRKNDEYYFRQPNESKPLKEKIIEDERVYLLRVGKLIERLTALVETRKKDIKNFKFKNFAFEKSDVRKVVEDTSDMLIKNLQLKIGEKVKSYTLNEIAEDLKNFDNSIDIIGRELTYKEIHGFYESVQATLSSWMTGKLSWNAPESAGIKSTKGFNFLYCTSLRVLYERLLNEGSTSTPSVFAPSQIEEREKIEAHTKRSEEIKNAFAEYGFIEYLKTSKGYNESQIIKIESLISENKTPFIIALLKEIGYLDYFKKEYCNDKGTEQHIKLGKVLGVTNRRIKGNIYVLIHGSTENKKSYESWKFQEEVSEIIKGL
jgi:hypothetical protein